MTNVIKINDVEFVPQQGITYRYNYPEIVNRIKSGEFDELSAYRKLILSDLWFLLYFVIKPFGKGGELLVNHPFTVQACRDIELGPSDYTLDVYAREHYKSSIITISESIQHILGNPDSAVAIFSYNRPVAKKFLFNIKEIFQSSKFLKSCFPDVIWSDCEKQSPQWSLDEGIILKRSTNRKEPSVSAWGLIEGMPTGLHFPRRVYDDIVTEDIAASVEGMEKVKERFDNSQNLGTMDGCHRVVGTFYHHNDPLVYIRDKKDIETGQSKYLLRLKPGSDDGTAQGKPVLLPQKRWDDLKITKSFNTQQLCDPTPSGDMALNSAYLIDILPQSIPSDIYKFMVIDSAESEDERNCSWAILLCGVTPNVDEIGASKVFILDAVISAMKTPEAIEEVVRMYLRGGIIERIGVEKVSQSTAELHIATALFKRGRNISVENGRIVILRPGGRKKETRIENALSWPLCNGKLFISSDVPVVYRDRLRNEMDKFPYWKLDGVDALSYLYDIIKDYRFVRHYVDDEDEIPDNLLKLNPSSRDYWLSVQRARDRKENKSWVTEFSA